MLRFFLTLIICSISLTFAFSQKIATVKIAEIEKLLNSPSEKIQVINFWATWCAPCVKEMPVFEKANREKKDSQVTLISLDLTIDPSPEKVYKFVERKKISSSVLILDETDANAWINKIDPHWTGALPATLVINTKTKKRKFIERELHEGELDEFIKEVKN